MPLPNEPFKVFISHATNPDGDLAYWIMQGIDRIHLRAFVYERYQRGGQNKFEVIKAMINLCPFFLVILTKNGIQSQWVNQEIGYAVATGKIIIPILEADINGKYLESKGFVELHDPILLDQNTLMPRIIYTLVDYAKQLNVWQDDILLSCKCGCEFNGNLQYDLYWSRFTPTGQSFPLLWNCPNCGMPVSVSFPDCHLL